jgi:hypothetical protein
MEGGGSRALDSLAERAVEKHPSWHACLDGQRDGNTAFAVRLAYAVDAASRIATEVDFPTIGSFTHFHTVTGGKTTWRLTTDAASLLLTEGHAQVCVCVCVCVCMCMRPQHG